MLNNFKDAIYVNHVNTFIALMCIIYHLLLHNQITPFCYWLYIVLHDVIHLFHIIIALNVFSHFLSGRLFEAE